MMKAELPLSKTMPGTIAMQPCAFSIQVCMHVPGPARNDVRVMREAVTLVRSGYAVTIVDVEGAPHVSDEEEIQGVCLKHISKSKGFLSTRLARWIPVRAAFILVQRTLRLLQVPADIYHAHDAAGLFPCYIASRMRKKPLIFDAHEVPLAEMTSIRPRWIIHLFSYLLQHIVPYCSGVITVSPPIAQEIHTHYHGPDVSLIRNIPPYKALLKSDRLQRHLALDPKTRIVLYQGYIMEERGFSFLIRAAKFLDPDIVIVIMGKDVEGYVSRLTALVQYENVTDRVKIIPPVTYADLFDWTASADIGVILYQPDHSLNIKMCLPNKFFEYLMAGLPILASQLDAIADIIQMYNVGKIVPSLAPQDIGEAINTMLADQAAYVGMRQNALYASKEYFCWEKEEQQLIQLYQHACCKKHWET